MEFKIDVCDGKYTYRYNKGIQEVWRYGKPWPAMTHSIVGNNFVAGLAIELYETRKEVQATRIALSALTESVAVLCNSKMAKDILETRLDQLIATAREELEND